MRALRQVSAGQGLMLESSSRRLMQPGMPHHNCPDKARTLLEIHYKSFDLVPSRSSVGARDMTQEELVGRT